MSGLNLKYTRIDIEVGDADVPGNVQWVYKCINMMKWKLSQREFIDMCKLVVENNP